MFSDESANRLKKWLKPIHDRLFSNHVYVVKHGYLRGYKRRGRMPWLQRDLQDPKQQRELAFLESLSLEGKVVYDIGAHTGSHALLFRRMVGERGQVFAFEPDPRYFDALDDTIQLNELKNVHANRLAIGKTIGRMTLTIPVPGSVRMSATLDPRLASTLGPEQRARTVRVAVNPLDVWADRSEAPAPDLIKVDVEGFELDVLEGAVEVIERAHPVVFVEVHGKDDVTKRETMRAIIELLTPLGYRFHHLEEDRALASEDDALPAGGHLVATYGG